MALKTIDTTGDNIAPFWVNAVTALEQGNLNTREEAAVDAAAALAGSYYDSQRESVNIANEIDVSGAIVTSAFQTLVNDVVSAKKTLWFPKDATPAIDARITLPSGIKMRRDPGSYIYIKGTDGTSGTSMLYGAGTQSARQVLSSVASIAAGAVSIPLPTGYVAANSIGPGTILGFESTAIVHGSTGQTFERRMVLSVSGDTVLLNAPLEWPYTNTTSAVHVVTATWKGELDIAFRLDPALATTAVSYPLRLEDSEDAVVRVQSFGRMCGGVIIRNAWRPTVEHRWNSLPHGTPGDGDGYTAPYTYGVAFVGATRQGRAHVVGSDCRHGFTTLSDSRSTGGTYGTGDWGAPQRVVITGFGDTSSPDSYMFFDCHEFAEDLTFDNCQVFGGYGSTVGDAGGFQDRGLRTKFINPVVRYGRRGIVFASTSRKGEVLGGHISKMSSNAMTFSTGATDCRAKGTRFSENDATCVAFNGTRSILEEPYFENNNTNTMIQDTGVTNGRIIRPRGGHSSVAGGTQNTIVLNAGTGTVEVIDAEAYGYGNNVPFFGLAANGQVRGTRRNSIPTVASAATLPLMGDGEYKVSGTTSITAISGVPSGGKITLIATAAWTLTNGANLKLAGAANFVATADDVITLIYDGTTFWEVDRSVN